MLSRSAFTDFKKRLDHTEYGGAPLLGVKGVCIITHGSSNANAIKNAVRVAAEFSERGINESIERGLGCAASRALARRGSTIATKRYPFMTDNYSSHSSSPAKARKPSAWAKTSSRNIRPPGRLSKKPTKLSATNCRNCASKARKTSFASPRSRSRRFSPCRSRRCACWKPRVPKPSYVAGHSLGEYSAHVASGTFSFADAVRTVRNRGKYMQEAVPVGVGAMAAILGMDLEKVAAVCPDAAQGEVCSPANINSPEQIVISGNTAAVERAAKLADERGAKRAKLLPVSAPFHCSLMKPAQDRLEARSQHAQDAASRSIRSPATSTRNW